MFQGASQDDSNKCGTVFVLKLSDVNFYQFKAHVGVGTNNRGELFALFYLLKWAFFLGVGSLNLYGDYSMVIQHVQGRVRITNWSLSPLAQKIQDILPLFDQVHAHHIFRELNEEADILSKQSLEIQARAYVLVHNVNESVQVSLGNLCDF